MRVPTWLSAGRSPGFTPVASWSASGLRPRHSGTINGEKLPKAGVYAVRQGPVLWENVQRELQGSRLVEYRPQRGFQCGIEHVVALFAEAVRFHATTKQVETEIKVSRVVGVVAEECHRRSAAAIARSDAPSSPSASNTLRAASRINSRLRSLTAFLRPVIRSFAIRFQ